MDSLATSIGICVPRVAQTETLVLEGSPMKHTVIGVDLAKDVFEIAVSHEPGKVADRHRVRRAGFLSFFAQRKPTTVVMEACGSAHYWGREIGELGHSVVLLPPHLTHRYVGAHKTDRTDTKGMLEAYRNEDILPVPVKSLEQQTLTTLHRMRAAYIGDRTAHCNALRGHLREFGHFIPLGRARVVPRVRELIADAETDIPMALRPHFAAQCDQIEQFHERIAEIDNHIQALAKQLEAVQLLMTIPGIGVLTATALVAWIGDVSRFKSGRHLASYLGLTPREHSSGARRWLGRISKRGDGYLRTLLIHGARSVLSWAKRKQPQGRLQQWALHVDTRRGSNKAAVALANKLARIVWAVWTRKRAFEPKPLLAAA